MTINTFEAFLENFDIPKACELKKPVFKKLFMDASDGEKGVLNATDKKCLTDDVNKVRWLYTLKPSTINIAPYHDQVREYAEVAVLQVELSSPNRMSRIAHFINRSIPYPLVLIFKMDADGKTSIAISLADKRTNQADKDKWVIEDSIHSGWISLADQSEQESAFLASLRITAFPFTDFLRFYQALMDRVIAIDCSRYSSAFTLGVDKVNRLEKLRELKNLGAQKTEIANKLKREKQIGRQIELNTKIKKFNDRIAEIKGSL